MSCIASLPDRFNYASFSTSYLDLNLAFIVRDHEREPRWSIIRNVLGWVDQN